MILEHVILPVLLGEQAAFEAAFVDAVPFISASPGFRTVRLSRCIEQPSHYLLLVEWDTLEAHTEGFRGSANYDEWRRLLHHFYEPFPTVEHYAPVALPSDPQGSDVGSST